MIKYNSKEFSLCSYSYLSYGGFSEENARNVGEHSGHLIGRSHIVLNVTP